MSQICTQLKLELISWFSGSSLYYIRLHISKYSIRKCCQINTRSINGQNPLLSPCCPYCKQCGIMVLKYLEAIIHVYFLLVRCRAFLHQLRAQPGSLFSRLFPKLCLQKVENSLYSCSYFFQLCSFHFFFIIPLSLMSENSFHNCWHSSFIPLRASKGTAHHQPEVSVLYWQALRHLSPSVLERMDKDRHCTSHHCLELALQEMLSSITLTGATSSSTYPILPLFYGPCPLLSLESAKAEKTLVPPRSSF